MNTLTAVVLLSPCLLVTALMIFFVAMRYITYRERVELAEHGYLVPEASFLERLSQRAPRGVLWAGVITAMSGLALLLGLVTIGIGWWLLGGLIPLFVGLGMLFMYFSGGLMQDRSEKRRESLPPVKEGPDLEQDA